MAGKETLHASNKFLQVKITKCSLHIYVALFNLMSPYKIQCNKLPSEDN